MRKIAAIVIVVIVLAIAVSYTLRLISLPGQPPQNSGGTKPPTTSLPTPVPTGTPPSSTGTPAPTIVPLPAPTPKPTPAPTPKPAPAQPPVGSNVEFNLAVTSVSGSGISRTVTAKVTNTGRSDAHKVWAKVEVFSKGTRIQLSGQDYLRVDIGTLAAGTTVTKEVMFTVSLFDGLKIAQSGATATLTIYSDEKTQTFSYDFTA